MRHHAHEGEHGWYTLARLLGARAGRIALLVLAGVVVLALLTLGVGVFGD